MTEYEWHKIVGSVVFSGETNKISRFIWAWQKKRFLSRGWTVDGGIWPRLRVTRPWSFEDYIHSRPSPLQELIDARMFSDGSAGIDRSTPAMWSTKRYDE